MVNDMILQQVNDGQFAQTPLTFQDITVIQEVFTERLITINHHRIQYPTIK
jgi:membrane-associated HD superfamily phosphohydrolase